MRATPSGALEPVPHADQAAAEPVRIGRAGPALVEATGHAHLLTVILEDYFHNFDHVIDRSHWHRFETRVERGTRRTLDLLDEFGIHATFFTVGWIAETLPELIAEVVARGHEVASKGFDQRGVGDLSRAALVDDLARAREALERASGRRVLGYRSPGWLSRADHWALELLAHEGYAYDSSVKPTPVRRHFDGGERVAHRQTFGDRTLWEFPVSSLAVAGLQFPIGVGNYFRQLPPRLMQSALSWWDRRHDAPFVMYFHTWEVDPDQPRITAISPLDRVRYYRNLDAMPRLLGARFREHRFTSIAGYLGLDLSPARSGADARSGARPVLAPSVPAAPAEQVRTAFTLVVPCFNEESTLPYLAKTLASLQESLAPRYAMDVVLVDDHSTDDTWGLLHRLFGLRSNYTLVRHETNQGPAEAILTGIRAARTEVVASIDCDCSYDPMELGRMIPLLHEGVDMVTASPYHPAGGVRNVPGWRLVLSRTLSGMYRLVLHHKLRTYTSCFRVYRRTSMADMTLTHPGFLGVVEMLGRVDLNHGRIVEFPTTLSVRLLGYSKMKVARTVLGHLGVLVDLARRRLADPAAHAAAREALAVEPQSRP